MTAGVAAPEDDLPVQGARLVRGKTEPEPEAEVSVGPHGDPLEDDVLDLLEHEVDFDDVLSDPIDDYDDLTAADRRPIVAANCWAGANVS